jgi:hypothetical protein
MTIKKRQKSRKEKEDDDLKTNFSGMFALGSMVKEDYRILKHEADAKPVKGRKKIVTADIESLLGL